MQIAGGRVLRAAGTESAKALEKRIWGLSEEWTSSVDGAGKTKGKILSYEVWEAGESRIVKSL